MRQIPNGICHLIGELRDVSLNDAVKYGPVLLWWIHSTLMEWKESGLIDDVLKKLEDEMTRRGVEYG